MTACEGRIKFVSRSVAESHAWALVQAGYALRSELRVWYCDRCDQWHVERRAAGRRKGRRRA